MNYQSSYWDDEKLDIFRDMERRAFAEGKPPQETDLYGFIIDTLEELIQIKESLYRDSMET